MTTSFEDLIRDARQALASGDAAAAQRAFAAALEHRESGEALEGLAQSFYARVNLPAAADAYERTYITYRREGDRLGAARAARILGWIHGNIYGDWAVQSGWVARAITLLEEAGADTVERGWVHILRGASEFDEDLLREAVAVGRSFDDPDVECEALGWLGLTLVFSDRVEEGMLLFDEALAAVCAGEVTDLTVVEGTFCGFFWACERTHDVARADQWMRTAQDMSNRLGLATMGAFCRAHYGGILTAAGRWPQAEAELVAVARLFADGKTAMHANAIVRLADLRVREGRFEEATQLLEGLHHHHDAVRPLAALHLARGETAVAADLIERALDAGVEAPMAGPLLALLVDVHVADGSVDRAASASERLSELAGRQSGTYLRAAAALAKGQVCIASETGDARACLNEALAGFSKAQMPMELACSRLELARALTEENPAVAVAEAKAALEAFERLEAARHADAAAALLRALGAPVRVGPKGLEALTKREAEVLSLLGHGLSNPAIAERLFISRKTVEHHVSRVLAKLSLRSRAEAAAYAARSGDGISR